MARSPLKPKDPNEYAWAVERGYAPRKIPKRPLFGKTLAEYEEKFTSKRDKALLTIKARWK